MKCEKSSTKLKGVIWSKRALPVVRKFLGLGVWRCGNLWFET